MGFLWETLEELCVLTHSGKEVTVPKSGLVFHKKSAWEVEIRMALMDAELMGLLESLD